jgi:NAD(P)-dependent dehydrogenase (short-subunit alcohol dehydrogenase family)
MTDKGVWFITGTGRGMGVDFAKAALAAGNAVVATGRNTDAVRTAVGEAEDLLVVNRFFDELITKAGVRRIRLLSRPGAQYRCCYRSVSPGRSPNPWCQFLGNGLSAVSAVRRGSWVARGLGSCCPGRRSETR